MIPFATEQLRTVPPNLHLKKLNPNIDLSNFACCIPDCGMGLDSGLLINAGMRVWREGVAEILVSSCVKIVKT